MRATLPLLITLGVVLLTSRIVAGIAEHGVPKTVSMIVVPSRYDGYVVKTGNVKATFTDGHTEVLTESADCHDAKISPKGNVGWIRIDKKSIDPE